MKRGPVIEMNNLSNLRILFLVAILCGAAFNVYSQDKGFDDSVLTENGRQAYRALLKEQLFAIGGISYGGQTSPGERAFNVLVDENEAVAAFRSLVRDATIEGGLYGLFGLRWKDCNCFQGEYSNFTENRTNTKNSEELRTMSGCLFFDTVNNEDKKLFIDLFSNRIDELVKTRKSLHEYHKQIEAQKNLINGVKKN